MTQLKQIALFLICCVCFTGCNTTQNNPGPNPGDKQALCREMKYQMIFNGKTGNQQTAMQQRAGMANLNRSYREAGCG